MEGGAVVLSSCSAQVMSCFLFPSSAKCFFKPSVKNTASEMLCSSISIV